MDKMTPYPTAMEKFPRVRQSTLSEFDRCALTTALSLEFEQGWSSHPQARGTVFHRVAAKGLEEMASQNEDTIPADVATAILREVLRQNDVDPRDVVNLPISEVKDLAWTVRKWAMENRYSIKDFIGAEERFNYKLRYPNPAGGFVERVFSGALDALFIEGEENDHAIVLDFKDSWAIPAATEVSFGGYFQQRAYALLVMRTHRSIERTTLREVYPRFSPYDKDEQGHPILKDDLGHPIPPKNIRQATVWRSDLDEIEAELTALVERFDRAVEHGVEPWRPAAKKQRTKVNRLIREGRKAKEQGAREDELVPMRERARAERVKYENMVGLWQPSPGAHCSWCVRPASCTIHPHARGAGRVRSQQDAERVAAEAIVADAIAKKSKDAIKVWADKHGPVAVKDAKGARKVWGHQAVERTKAPTPAQVAAEVEAAAREGREPNIQGLWRKTAGSMFKVHNPKPQADLEDTVLADLEASLALAQARKAS